MTDVAKGDGAAHRVPCPDQVSAVAGGRAMPAEVLAERLMLAICAYGTNTGIRASTRLQREITEGRNVVESFNRANAVIYSAKATRSPPTTAANTR